MSDIRAIVAGHGTFAEGMLSAIEQITGRSDLFLGLTNRDLSARDMEQLMRDRIEASNVRVVFTDLPAGSCTMAARRIARSDPNIAVVTGASVGMLLDFALGTAAGRADLDRATVRGREAMIVFPPSGGPGAA